MPDNSLVAVECVLREMDAKRSARPRSVPYVLIGLAVGGWMGFLVLAGLNLTSRLTSAPLPEAVVPVPEAPMAGTDQKTATQPQVEPERASPPVNVPVIYGLTYEERRRVQELMRQALASDEDGNVATARTIYNYAANKGWPPAALALALTYDPHELQRRFATIVADPAKARACYLKARDLMDATVSFYLSRLPPGGDGERC